MLSNLIKTSLAAVIALGFVASLQAADATGTWSWTRPGRNGGADIKTTLTLKAEGEKLTGKVSMPGRQGGDPRVIEITEGKVKGDEISFSVTTPGRNGGTGMTTKYTGKVASDTIKGKIERPGRNGGDPTSTDWEAKREAKK